MMINKRLIGIVPESRKYIAGNVALQWLSLVANMVMMAALLVRFGCAIGASKMSYLSSKEVKKTLRRLCPAKLEGSGNSFKCSQRKPLLESVFVNK